MAKDPYKYFRVEARELIEALMQGSLQLEKEGPSAELVARMLRQAHTLKGAARVVKQPGIAELAHRLEGLLQASPAPAGLGNQLLGLVDQMTTQLRALEPKEQQQQQPQQQRPAGGSPSAHHEETPTSVRVEASELDSLLRGVSDAGVQAGALRKELAATERLRQLNRVLLDQLTLRPGQSTLAPAMIARAVSLCEELQSELDRLSRSFTAGLERVSGGLSGVEELAQRLRLIPARTVFSSLERAVRDAAQELGKAVDFEASGGDVRLDAQVLALLRDGLMHVVRNSVTHGLERSGGERIAKGKPARGKVRLVVERRDTRVAFICSDDGAGVDAEKVRAAAMARGVPVPASLTTEQALALLQTGGLSTSGQITELSGRGIGLDVVRATTTALKGELRLRSEPGQSMTVEVIVPVSIASMQGLVVEAAGATASIPLDSVRQTLRVGEGDVARAADREAILHEGKLIPFLPLDSALGRQRVAAARGKRPWSAVVVQSGEQKAAVGVDRLLGTARIVMRSLPEVVEADPVIAGASLDAGGNPQPVLDPAGLVAAAQRPALERAAPEAPRAPVLVIDDSLTTRMLEKSILSSAGYEVELAVSAEEGLQRAREKRYSLFVVDVEMPGMDGFSFVAETRADPTLREIPAILVTSRNAPEDLRRGELAGARGYIVKGEFDQGQLLKTIRKLIG